VLLRVLQAGWVALARRIRDRLERQVDVLELREVRGQVAAALVVAVLVGHLGAQREVVGRAVVEPDAVGGALLARRQLGLNDQLGLVALGGDDRDALVVAARSVDRSQQQLAQQPCLRARDGRLLLLAAVVVAAGEQDHADDQPGDPDQADKPGHDAPAPDRRLRVGGELLAAAQRRPLAAHLAVARLANRTLAYAGLAVPLPVPVPLARPVALALAAARRGLDLRVGDLRPVAVVHVVERVHERRGPGAAGLRAPEQRLGRRLLAARLLAEHVVGDLAAAVGLDPVGAGGRERDQRVARKLAHPGARDVEHVRELVVRAPAREHEVDDRPLLRGQLVQGRHLRAKG
jgi:hypothetical protein